MAVKMKSHIISSSQNLVIKLERDLTFFISKFSSLIFSLLVDATNQKPRLPTKTII